MYDANCPYCNAEIEIDHDDGYGYEEGELHNQECPSCGKYFAYTTSIIINHETYKADCLNDGKHDWKPTITNPKEFTRMECTMCGETRALTELEKEQILTLY